MKKQYEYLLGELIGLARATDGNEHLISSSSTAVVLECLSKVGREEADVEELSVRITEEKRKMVPDCFYCANPCGKTSPCNLSEIPYGENREYKFQLLDKLCRLAAEFPDAEECLFYRCLVAVGLEDYEKEELIPLIEDISNRFGQN